MRAILRALWPYLRLHRGRVAIVAVAMVMEVVTAAAMPWPLKLVFDRVLFKQGSSGKPKLRTSLTPAVEHLFYTIVAAAIVIAIVDATFTWLDTYHSQVSAQRAIAALRRDVFSHLQRLSASFHQHPDTRVGDLGARLSGDIGALQDVAAGGVSSIVTNGLTIIVMSVLMVVVDPVMASVALAGLIPMALASRRTTRSMRVALRDARKQEGRVAAVVQESLASIRVVQAYGREDTEAARLADANDKSLTANLRAAGLMARVAPTSTVLAALTTAALTVVGVRRVLGRDISPGELLIFLAYLRGMQGPIRQLARLGYSISKATAGLERIQEVLAREPDVHDLPGARRLDRCAGAVAFRGVRFGYDPARPVLHDVTLDLPAGATLALVGATGSGKSTLLSLLPRFHDPQAGAVLLDGRDVREITLHSLRGHVALVLQDTLIFRMSVWDNIAYARPEASGADILAAARAAGVDRIVERLDGGFEAVASERGTSLSGGEKQCISIARALLRGSPVIVLDEPTSAMDAITEQLVLDGIDRLLRRRTVLMIAHRLSTVMKSDVVAVLDAGRIIETGPPAALIDDPTSAFHRMASVQRLFGSHGGSVAQDGQPLVVPSG